MRRSAFVGLVVLFACVPVAWAAVHAGTYRGSSNAAEGPEGKVKVTLIVTDAQRMRVRTGAFYMPCNTGVRIVNELDLHGTRALVLRADGSFDDTFSQRANLHTTGSAKGTTRVKGHFNGRSATGTITSTLKGSRARCTTHFGFRARRR